MRVALLPDSGSDSLFADFSRDLLSRFAPDLAPKPEAPSDEWAAEFGVYQKDPERFVREVPGDILWPKQVEIIEALRDTPRVTVRSCHGSGKTYLSARAVLWFLLSHQNSIVITTAPTWRQVQELLWRDIAAAVAAANQRRHARGLPPLPGSATKTRYELGPKWFALGLSTNQPERFQGFHAASAAVAEADLALSNADYWSAKSDRQAEGPDVDGGRILFVGDEASGILEAVYEASHGFLTTAGSKMLLVGNPNRSEGQFFKSHKRERRYSQENCSGWSQFHISAYDVPEELLDREWIEGRKAEWGEDSPAFQVRVLGNFPTEGENSLFPMHALDAAQYREVDTLGAPLPEPLDEEGQYVEPVEFGIDCANGGGDENVVWIRSGCYLLKMVAWRSLDTTENVSVIDGLIREWRPKRIKIDAGVSGKLVGDALRIKFPEVRVDLVWFGGGARNPVRFAMARDEMYWQLRNVFRSGHITGLEDEKTIGQLSPVLFSEDGRGRIRVESKDEMRRRGHKEFDRADSLCLAFYNPKESRLVPTADPDDETLEAGEAREAREEARAVREHERRARVSPVKPQLSNHVRSVMRRARMG